MRDRTSAVVLLTAGALALGGCSAGPADGSTEDATVLDIYAAASLNDTFTELAGNFEAEHAGVEVTLNFAGSSTLVQQLTEGASADVLATADERTMAGAVDEGLVEGSPEVFATNVLTVVVPAGNPAGVASVQDLENMDVQTVVCAPQVPCGAATAHVTEAAGVSLAPVSEESSVTDVLGQVTSGQADAGLVYVTDARSAGDAVERIEIPEADQAVNRYPVAVLEGSDEQELARQFVELATGLDGREILAESGFGSP